MPFTLAAEMSLTYDVNGNLITGDGKYRTYNSLNQLWKVYNGTNSSGILLEEYYYHPVEERVAIKKVYNSSGSVIETTYYFSKEFVRVINTTGVYNYTYVYQDGTLVAQDVNGVKTFFVNDAKNNIVATINSTGSVIDQNFYSPSGEITSSNNKSRYSYESKEFDSISKDTDFNARKYRPDWGIFITPDNQLYGIYSPQNLNRYTCDKNNFYKYEDKDGKNPFVIAAVIGFAWNSVYYMRTHEGSGWSHVGNTMAYGLAGAIEWGSAVSGPGGAGLGAAGGRAIERAVEGESVFSVEAGMDYFSSGIIAAGTFKISQVILPQPRMKLIKNPSSWFSSKTGQLFIADQFIENAISTPIIEGKNRIINQIQSTSLTSILSKISSRTSRSHRYAYNNPADYPNDPQGVCSALQNNNKQSNYISSIFNFRFI